MALQPGDLVRDRYEIRRIITSGGMGSVYEAWDRNLSSPCAVKEMLEVVVRSEDARLVRAKFKAEAEMLVRLEHPGIPRVRDFLTEGETCYVVMDLVHGANLEQELGDCQALTGRPFLPTVLVKDILQVLDVLVYLHGLNPPVIHRDVKPANIIREFKGGRVKLVDFGLARSAEVGHSQTMVGTLGYCPLEQMQGHAEPRSDIYAVGVSMHQLLTGCVPAVLALEPLEKVAPELDSGLVDIIGRATSYEPEDRFGSAADMRAALERWRASLQAPAPAPKPEEPSPILTTILREEPPPPAGWTLPQAALFSAACLFFLGLGLWKGGALDSSPATAPTQIGQASDEPTEVVEITPTPLPSPPEEASPEPQERETPVPLPEESSPPISTPVVRPRISATPRPLPWRHRPALLPDPAYPRANPNSASLSIDWPDVGLQMSLPAGFHKVVPAGETQGGLSGLMHTILVESNPGGPMTRVLLMVHPSPPDDGQILDLSVAQLTGEGWSVSDSKTLPYSPNSLQVWRVQFNKPEGIQGVRLVVRRPARRQYLYTLQWEYPSDVEGKARMRLIKDLADLKGRVMIDGHHPLESF